MPRIARVAAAALLATLVTPPGSSAQSLDLGFANTGISIGNSREWTGIRLNWRDVGVRRVDGINLTVWQAGENPDFRMRGIALGVVGPQAATISGVALGLGGVHASERLSGIALGGLGVVSEGEMSGIALAGLGTVSQGRMTGIQAAGLGLVSQGDMRGISVAGLGLVSQGGFTGVAVAGLGLVSQGDMRGIHIGGLATVTQGDLTGLNFGGLATVTQGDLTGLNVGGLATVTQGEVSGINVSGLATVAEGDVRGLTVSGLANVASDRLSGLAVTVGVNVAPETQGIAIAAARLRTETLTGLSVAGYNQVLGIQRGITIGLYNKADELHGVQLGLLNFAGNNRGPARWLPILNMHF